MSINDDKKVEVEEVEDKETDEEDEISVEKPLTESGKDVESTPIHSDDLVRLGLYGKLVCIFVEIAMLSQLSNTMIMVYAGDYCVSSVESTFVIGSTPTIKSCGNVSFVTNDDACANYHHCRFNQNVTFERQFYGVTEQFKLLCDDAKLEKLGTSIQMIGLMFGCLVFGQISDLFGRKWPMMICLIMCSLFGFLSAFAPSFWYFTVLRTILCFFNGGQSTISVVYMIENVPKQSRMYLSTLISYSPNVILLGIIAYCFQSWNILAIVISLFILPAIFLLAFLQESPRWLMQKGRVEEAKRLIMEIDKVDGVKNGMSEQQLGDLLSDEYKKYSSNTTKQHSFWHLFSTRKTAIGTFVIAFTFFSTTTINYSNMFNLGAISGSIYMNSILIGLLRYSVSIASGYLDYKFIWFNRKTSHGVCSMFTIAAIFTIILIYMGGTISLFSHVVRYCVLISCAMTAQSIIVASVTSNELMPTAIRSLSYSVAQLSSRFGMVFAPHIFYLNLYLNNDNVISSDNFMISLPYFILLLLVVADLLFFRYLIPETKNKPLEDHIIRDSVRLKDMNTCEVDE